MFTTVVSSAVTGLLSMVATWIFHLQFPVRTTAVPPTNAPAAPPVAAQPVIDLSTHAHAAGLDSLLSLFKALETMNAPFILSEARALSALVAHYGGFAQLLDNALNQILEARLAAGQAELLQKVADASKVTPRELLDALEGKPGSAAAILAALKGTP